MSLQKIFVYVDSDTKDLVNEVAHRLRMSESNLMRTAALPTIRTLAKALEAGAKPEDLRKKLMERRAE